MFMPNESVTMAKKALANRDQGSLQALSDLGAIAAKRLERRGVSSEASRMLDYATALNKTASLLREGNLVGAKDAIDEASKEVVTPLQEHFLRKEISDLLEYDMQEVVDAITYLRRLDSWPLKK